MALGAFWTWTITPLYSSSTRIFISTSQADENSAYTGSLFASDGGDPEMAAHAPDGKYIQLLRPRAIPDVAGIHAANSADLITPGAFDAERLVDLNAHDYRSEPNASFTPDGKWLVFRSNMWGPGHVYAVEVAKAGR